MCAHQTRTRGGYRGRRRVCNRDGTKLEGRGDYTETVRLVMKTARMRGNTFQQHRAKRVAARLAHQPLARCFFTRMVPGNRRAGGQGKRTSRIEVRGLRWPWARRGHWRPTRLQSALKNAAKTPQPMGVACASTNGRGASVKSAAAAASASTSGRGSQCKDCGNSDLCEHQRRRSRCKDCDGSGIYEHQRRRATAKTAAAAASASTRRSRCKDCGGSAFCEHQREKHKCKVCRGAKDKAAPGKK